MKNSKIDFIGIGAQKAGTSWLFDQFNKSSQFSLPPIKEMHYFDRSVKYLSPNNLSETKLKNRIINPKWLLRAIIRSVKDIKNINWYWQWYFSDYSDHWYLSLFKKLDKCKGEITPAYAILNEKDIERMSVLLGKDTRIILMLRNPIERAWSSYKYLYYTQQNPERKFKEASDFLKSDYQLLRSQYSRTMVLYKKYFDSVFVGFFDAITEDPKCLLENIFKYLELDSQEVNILKGIEKPVNVSKSVEMPSEIKKILEDIYSDEIHKLSLEYGGYFLKWKNPKEYENETFSPSFILKK
jgi:hypothetical protein